MEYLKLSSFLSNTRMSTIISWQKRFTKSRRNWKRRDAHGKKIATLWPQPGHSSLDCLSPTPCARHNLFGLQVSSLLSFNSELNFDRDIKTSVSACRWTCFYAQHAKSNDEPHAGVSRYVFYHYTFSKCSHEKKYFLEKVYFAFFFYSKKH